VRAGAAGGQLPAGLVPDLDVLAGQHGAHTPRQGPVGDHQRHRRAPGLHVPQHAGGGTLGLVLGVAGTVESRHGGAGLRLAVEREHGHALAPHRLQCGRQRVGLEARNGDQRIGGRDHARLIEHVAGIGGVRRPGHGQLGHDRLQQQGAGLHAGRRGAAGTAGPGRAVRGGHRRRQRAQLLRGFEQQRRGGLGAGPETGLFQQGARRQHVERRVEAEVGRRRRETTQAAAPVLRGLEARRKAVGVQAGPQARGLRHQLRIGQQDHGAGRMRGTCAHVGIDAGQPLLPTKVRGFCHNAATVAALPQ
jgi:hypothetical protein